MERRTSFVGGHCGDWMLIAILGEDGGSQRYTDGDNFCIVDI